MRNSEIILRFTREFMCKIWCPSFPPSPPHSFSFPWFSSSLSIYFNSPKLCPSSLKTQCTWGVLSKIWQICLIWPVHALEQKPYQQKVCSIQFSFFQILTSFQFTPAFDFSDFRELSSYFVKDSVVICGQVVPTGATPPSPLCQEKPPISLATPFEELTVP